MKVVLVLAVLVAVAVAENCTTTRECYQHGITHCGNGYHVVCHNHQCDCTNGPTGHRCTTRDDCTQYCDSAARAHCIDQVCHCGRDVA